MSERLLIIGPSWVGDMVVAQSLFKQCRQLKPHREIHVVAPKWSRPLLEFMPEVDRVIPLEANHGEFAWSERRQIGKQLRENNYQQAIVIPRSFKAALIPYWAKIPKRTGWFGEYRWGLLNDIRQLDKKKYPSLRERYSHLGLDKNDTPLAGFIPELTVSDVQIQATLAKLGLEKQGKVVAICPGAEYGPAKRWPAQHVSHLASLLKQQDVSVWILGSPKDQEIASDIVRLCDEQCVNLTGKTSLQDAIACLAIADCVVCNDSGLMHIAAALGTPLVAIYGSSDPNYTPPLSNQATVISKGLDCSPCFQRVCPLGHTACLDIAAPQVCNAVLSYLE